MKIFFTCVTFTLSSEYTQVTSITTVSLTDAVSFLHPCWRDTKITNTTSWDFSWSNSSFASCGYLSFQSARSWLFALETCHTNFHEKANSRDTWWRHDCGRMKSLDKSSPFQLLANLSACYNAALRWWDPVLIPGKGQWPRLSRAHPSQTTEASLLPCSYVWRSWRRDYLVGLKSHKFFAAKLKHWFTGPLIHCHRGECRAANPQRLRKKASCPLQSILFFKDLSDSTS